MIINLATEDELSEIVCEKIVSEILPDFRIELKLRQGGNGYLRRKLFNFNEIAKRSPLLLLTDLDGMDCPIDLIQGWKGDRCLVQGLLFRVVVKEIEAWLMADREAFSNQMGISLERIPENPDVLADPKAFLLHAARRAPRRIRQELIKTRGTVASQGIGYNRKLGEFVIEHWSPERAAAQSQSLSRCLARLHELRGN